jgi:hypothetical protein
MKKLLLIIRPVAGSGECRIATLVSDHRFRTWVPTLVSERRSPNAGFRTLVSERWFPNAGFRISIGETPPG